MALTVVVLGSGSPQGEETDGDAPVRELSLSFDAPRVVLGRAEGCELRLPDPSVSLRHASIRQRGAEYLLLDEGSTNGTFFGGVRLPPQAPRVVRSGDRIRLGRIWLGLCVEPVVKPSTPADARELALELVSRGLEQEGEPGAARLVVTAGPDTGRSLRVERAGKPYVIGRARDVDLPLEDPDASRRHVDVVRKGDTLLVHDLGSKGGVLLDELLVGEGGAAWRRGQELALGSTRIVFEFPAAEALAELERSADEPMRDGERPPEPPREAEDEPEEEPGAEDATDAAMVVAARRRAQGDAVLAEAAGAGWSITDGAVLLVALGVLALSVAGLYLVLKGP